MKEKKTIVTGVIGADAHTIGNRIITYALQESGFNAISLGTLVSQEEFVHAAVETGADAIMISSLYGMGLLDCKGLRDKCKEAGLKDILLYIGGLLETAEEEWSETEKKYKEIGFDRVYPPGTTPDRGIADLKNDLGIK